MTDRITGTAAVIGRKGTLLGYARASSRTQSLDVQIAALTAAGVDPDHLFAEKASATTRDGRPELAAALRYARRGDALVCTRLDRLARSTRDLLDISETLQKAGVDLIVLDQSISTVTPEGRLFFTLVGAFGEFESEIRKQRQREGIDAVLARGADSPFRGRPPSISVDEIAGLARQGMYPAQIAAQMGVSRQSVYRIAAANGIKLTPSRTSTGAAAATAPAAIGATRTRRRAAGRR